MSDEALTPESIETLQNFASESIDKCQDPQTLEQLRVEFLGKEGKITKLMKLLGNMSAEERKTYGPLLNGLKTRVNDLISQKQNYFKEEEKKRKLDSEYADLTLPPFIAPSIFGGIHPISKVIKEICDIFTKYGFAIASGPDIETDFYNFTALNFPENHPAREMHDTFFMQCNDKNGKAKVLRTHTSPVQIHTMECTKPPLRVIIPGKTYRKDEDITHTPMFHQLEGLMIDETASMAELVWILEDFCKTFFNSSSLKMRFRPSFFPFTQPSMEVDINYSEVDGELKIGSGDKWLEVLGCGMVHPNVLKAGYIDPEQYQGFAWGLGIERLAMLKYGIKDLRSFFSSNAHWLTHYNFTIFDK